MTKVSTVACFLIFLGIGCATVPDLPVTPTETLVAKAFTIPDGLLVQLRAEKQRSTYPFPEYVTLPNGPGLRISDDRVVRLLRLSQVDEELFTEQPLVEAAEPFQAYISGAYGA